MVSTAPPRVESEVRRGDPQVARPRNFLRRHAAGELRLAPTILAYLFVSCWSDGRLDESQPPPSALMSSTLAVILRVRISTAVL